MLALAPGGDAVLVAAVTPTQTIELLRVPLDGSPADKLPGSAINARKRLSMSADGQRMVWSDCLNRTHLAVVESPRGAPPRMVPLAGGEWNDAQPTAIPGTRQLLFLSDRIDGIRVWHMDRAQAGPVRRVDSGPHEPVNLAVSPDGSQVALAEGVTGLYLAPVTGAAAPRRLIEEAGELHPSFDRTGKTIYFERQEGTRPRIASIPVAGGQPTWVLPAGTLAPAASPTEDVLAYLVVRDGGTFPMLLDLRSRRSRPLTDQRTPSAWRQVRFSADGRRVLLVRPTAAIAEVDVATGRILREIDGGAEAFVGATFLGDDIIVGLTGWNGDLWTATLAPP